MRDNEKGFSGKGCILDLPQRSKTAKQNETFFGRGRTPSSRAIDDIPLPEGAIGTPEVFVDVGITEEDIRELKRILEGRD